MKQDALVPDEGSSPRLRGTRAGHSYHHGFLGIIPALAGNTQTAVVHMDYSRDHPRACGEHVAPPSPSGFLLGSSPRLRGTPRACSRMYSRTGIIPALAGNTSCSGSPLPQTADHPRACGEHSSITSNTSWILGSSPRLRGTLKKFCMFPYSYGIIPALAGNTSDLARAHRFWRDHPRACGEHVIGVNPEIAALGSSPRLRGTPRTIGTFLTSPRIIPALAGNTTHTSRQTTICGDHPRACGEHEVEHGHLPAAVGSSPRLRGTPSCRAACVRSIGIIPALAGNTPTRWVTWSTRWDHPRACGEHPWFSPLRSWWAGSSPRLRGTRQNC